MGAGPPARQGSWDNGLRVAGGRRRGLGTRRVGRSAKRVGRAAQNGGTQGPGPAEKRSAPPLAGPSEMVALRGFEPRFDG